MYPKELRQYISERNGCLNKTETLFVTNINLHQQLTRVTYDPWSNSYNMFDRYGGYYHFTCKGD